MTKVSPTNLLAKVEGTNSIRDIKPPVDVPMEWTWVLWVLVVLALGALLWWLWRRKHHLAESLPAESLPPPHLRARRRLREALLFLSDPAEFCTRVSSAIRWYLEERFDFHAPERTTEEFLTELRGTNLLTDSQKMALSEFLQRCDLVKFARYEPAEPELMDLHASASRLVDETEPVATAPVAPGAHAPEPEPPKS
jgi:hypothetical protein